MFWANAFVSISRNIDDPYTSFLNVQQVDKITICGQQKYIIVSSKDENSCESNQNLFTVDYILYMSKVIFTI